MITEEQMTGNWNQLKGLIREKWGQITDDELQEVQGEFGQLVGMIQQKTGEARHEIERTLDRLSQESGSLIDSAHDYFNQASESVRAAAGEVGDRVRSGYSNAEQMVKQRPAESVAVAFGTGLIAGVIVGLVLRSK